MGLLWWHRRWWRRWRLCRSCRCRLTALPHEAPCHSHGDASTRNRYRRARRDGVRRHGVVMQHHAPLLASSSTCRGLHRRLHGRGSTRHGTVRIRVALLRHRLPAATARLPLVFSTRVHVAHHHLHAHRAASRVEQLCPRSAVRVTEHHLLLPPLRLGRPLLLRVAGIIRQLLLPMLRIPLPPSCCLLTAGCCLVG